MPTKSSSSSSGGSSSSSSSSPSRTMTTTNCGASRMAATATNGGPKIAATSRIQINAAPPSSTTVDQKTCARKSPKATTMAGANATPKDGGHRRKKSRSDVQSDFLSKIANLESKDNSITDSSELREDRSETQLDSESNVKISATTESIATYDNGKFEQAYNLQSESGNQPKRSTMNLHSFIPKLENPNLYHEVSNEYPDAMQSPSSQITENSLDEDQIMSIKNQENQFASNLSTQLYYNNPTQSQVFSPCIKSQNYETIENLCTQMGYRIYQENGQRKFCSPEYDTIKLEKGCEVFIGKIPRDCFEDELVPILSNVGKIHELRLMMDFSGTTRGFGFVSYFSPDEAQKAVAHLNNYEIRPGVFIGVCLSIDNCRLFIGGIPKFKTKQEIFDEMSKITDDVVDVIVYPSVNDKMKNRGFAFVEYQTHRAAAMARRRLIPGKISLWGSTVAVDWAEPELDVPRGIMSTVKILYVRNLMLFTTEESLYHIFANAAECDVSDIERVRKLRDFCFVHFTKREDALQAMEKINGTQIDGSTVEVSLAKPVDKTTHYYNRFHRMHHNHAHNNNHNGNGTNNVMYGGGSFIKNANSLINPHYMRFYNGNNLPRNAAGNVNRHLNPNQPDGVYHQPTSQIFRPQIVGPMQAPAPNVAGIENELMFFNNNQHQRFPTLPVNQPHQQPNVSGSFFSCVKLLEDICYANHWGSPSYDLSIYTTQSGVFYSFHVNIPNLIKFFSKELLASVDCDEFGTFSAKDFIVGLEEAKEICAGRIISCLDSLSQKNVIKSPSTNQETNQLSSNQNDENVELRNMLNTSDVLQSLKLHQTNKNQYDYNSNQEVNADDVNDDATTTSEINVNNNNNETSRSDSFSQYHVYADKAQLATKR